MNIFSNKNISSYCTSQFLIVMAACTALTQFAWAQTIPSNYTNTGSIANTRHNLSMLNVPVNPATGASPPPAIHNKGARNQYEEVCVYCHTPHGANQTANGGPSIVLPLWNRTIKDTNYFTYNELGTTSLTQDVSDTPGPASLTCLSCHDGQTAIDSIINMPGSGMGDVNQATTQNVVFLNSWNNTGGAADTIEHRGINSTNTAAGGYRLGNGTGSDGVGCMTCHSPVGAFASVIEGNDMRLFNIGTDLRNDHPIGVTYPTVNGPNTDWNTPEGVKGSSNFFDRVDQGGNGNGRMDKAEIRTYEGKVECASCHDPHGVPGTSGVFKPTFLRVDNSAGSAVCLTCHVK